jgi:plasmid stability protein
VVIDPLMEFIDGKVDSHKSQPVRQAVAALNLIAREHGCAVLVILHLNKSASTDPLLRHEGSAAFTQVVRGGLMLGQDPDDPDGEEGNQRVLAVSSSNLAPLAKSLVYRIDTSTVEGDTAEAIQTARMVHIGESDANGHDLLATRQDDEHRSAQDEARDFLETELANGAMPASDIQAAAKRVGIADKPLRCARVQLGIKPEKTGFKGGWEWALPEDALPPPTARAPSHDTVRGHLGEIPLVERDCDPVPAGDDAEDALSHDEGILGPDEQAEVDRIQAKFEGSA